MGVHRRPPEGFGEFDHAQYAEEVEERWGGTDAYRESMRRTKSYDKADWASVQAEADDIMNRFAELMESGADPESEEARALAEEHRRHIGASGGGMSGCGTGQGLGILGRSRMLPATRIDQRTGFP